MAEVTLHNLVGHFRTITQHKLLVTKLMFSVGLGLQGLAHDNSKYLPCEFLTGARYYQGTRSPNAVEREERGFTEAWMHHKGCNRHHFEYWMDVDAQSSNRIVGMPMPTRYIVEMFCDRVSACKTYQKEAYTDASPLEYFWANEYSLLMHIDTAAQLEYLLEYLADHGEEQTLLFIRNSIVRPRFCFGEGARF